MKTPLVMIQAVNYNGLILTDVLHECLDSIKRQTYANTVVHIIDNNSTDRSVKWIGEHFPDFRITAASNTGYVSNNRGLSMFFKYNADYLLIINNDLVLEDNFVEKMVLFSENRPGMGISSGILHLGDKRDYINSTGILLNRAAFAANRDYGKPLSEKLGMEKIAGVSGGCMFISKAALKATGLFDTLYGSYYEDTDLCIRLLTETDMGIGVNMNAHAYHKPTSSWSKYPLKKDFLILRNQYMLLLKLFPMNLLAPAKLYLIRTRMFKRNLLHTVVFLNLFILLPVILIKRIVHSIKSRRSIDGLLVKTHAPFPAEEDIVEYADIRNICPEDRELTDRVLLGINDSIIGPGFSPLCEDYPKGRYINKQCTVYIKHTGKYLLIHGQGRGHLTVNSNEHFSVNGYFDIYAEHVTNSTVIIRTQDRIKLIELRSVNEKT